MFGYIDLNCIVNNNGIYPLEFTARFRLSHHQHSAGRNADADRAIFPGPGRWQRPEAQKPAADFRSACASSCRRFRLMTTKRLILSPRISVIVFKKPPQDENSYRGREAGERPVVGCGNFGRDPDRGRTGSHDAPGAIPGFTSRIKNVLIPNMYYRTDIGDRWVEDTDRLHTWGYLR